MAIKASGTPLKFSEIATEFGTPSGKNIGAYRVSENVGTLSGLPLDNLIPKTGQIRFSDFYNKKLNIVVNCTAMNDLQTRVNAKAVYDSPSSIAGTSVRVIGGFKGKPGNTNGSKVYINTNSRIGSQKGAITYTAFRTGSWDSGTELLLEIGSSTRIYGSGGNGGNGGTGDPTAGANGTSALGIDYPTAITNRGYIQAGFGGGGGGSYAASNVTINSGKKNSFNEYQLSSGGGGGGGAGYPGGDGGSSGGSQGRYGSSGSAGSAGGLENQGIGGGGGSGAGAGGNGGQPAATDASKGGDANVVGAGGGGTGYAIIFYNDSTGSSITNLGSGTIYPDGRFAYNTSPS
jgi:hypothetical protein